MDYFEGDLISRNRLYEELQQEIAAAEDVCAHISPPFFRAAQARLDERRKFLGMVVMAPGIPAESRKIGAWVQDSLATNIFKCSECGADAPVDAVAGCEIRTRFCCCCGAKMAGGGTK